jgi:hypothetical protein
MLPPSELDDIREKAAAFDDADLQMFPVVYTHRAQLLKHIKGLEEAHTEIQTDHDSLVKELDVLLNGGGAAERPRLCDIVAQVRRTKEYETAGYGLPAEHHTECYTRAGVNPGCNCGAGHSPDCGCGVCFAAGGGAS